MEKHSTVILHNQYPTHFLTAYTVCNYIINDRNKVLNKRFSNICEKPYHTVRMIELYDNPREIILYDFQQEKRNE